VKRTNYYLRITPDHLRASLHSSGTEEELAKLGTGQELLELLAHQGIIHGLDQDALTRAATFIDKKQPLPGPLILAAGTPPTAGRKALHPRFIPVDHLYEEIDEDGASQQIEIALVPLVRKGELLTVPGPPTQPQTGKDIFGREIAPSPAEQVFLPGDNVTADKESPQLLAMVSGYPTFTSSKKGSVENVHLGIEALVQTTPDRMQARMSVKPAPPGHSLPDVSTVLQVLDEERIVFGQLNHAIEQCLELCAVDQIPHSAVIALGCLPINGKDAWLRFEMEVGSMPGKLMGSGEIDYRERNMFIGVSKDELIAVRIPPSPGSPGHDVFGTPIAQTPGKEITIKATDDAVFNEETGEIRAGRSGVLSMVSEGSVKVCSRLIISSDVDFNTGNIVSRDAVEIKGSIKPKFRVNALGDILIRGNIENATVRSDSTVVVQAGMIGDNAVINARGDVDIQFVERGKITAKGTILLRRNGYYCSLHSDTNICCEPSSRVLAAQLVAAGSLTVGTVGSDNADPSMLAAGVSLEQFQRFHKLQNLISAQFEAAESMQRQIGQFAENEELDEMIEALEQSREQANALNLIVPPDKEPPDRGLSHALQCTIVVKGTVFAGTEIRIGNSRMTLGMTKKNVCFRLDEQLDGEDRNRDILILPNKK
jgi:uncharacterized protein